MTVRRATVDDAEVVLAVTRQAFAEQQDLGLEEPESVDDVREMLNSYPAWLYSDAGGRVIGVIRTRVHDGRWFLRRAAVLPGERGRGVGALLAAAVEAELVDRGVEELWAGVWNELQDNLAYWERRGFAAVRDNGRWTALVKRLPVVVDVPTAADMRALGERLASVLRAGDLVLLTGELGAGKTTLTQGIGDGLGVRGPVTSPTFVIARVHPSLTAGVPLVHVDAYRLTSLLEVEDLDLDATLEGAVTVVEWGEGKVEGLAESRLEVVLHRGDETDARRGRLGAVGPRWSGVRLREIARGQAVSG